MTGTATTPVRKVRKGADRPRRRTGETPARSIPSTVILWILALAYLIPVVWFLLSSFKPGSELFSLPLRLFPENWTLGGYETAWNRFDFARYFRNTATVAIVTTILTVIVSAMTGYAFAKYKAWWLRVFFICILATTMLPTEVIMPSSFVVVRDLQMYNTLAGIIVPSIITATGIFMFRQYFVTVPDELMEAARIDGVGEFRLFLQIMLPLARPIAVVLAIFSFQWRWNDYTGLSSSSPTRTSTPFRWRCARSSVRTTSTGPCCSRPPSSRCCRWWHCSQCSSGTS